MWRSGPVDHRPGYPEATIRKGESTTRLIAHNVVIEENSLIVAQVGISACRIGSNVTLGGQVAGTHQHRNNVMIGAQSEFPATPPNGITQEARSFPIETI
jgi:UDP-3-O-[3-hydroxymyristoyl] glucosamine N-acyltransferase